MYAIYTNKGTLDMRAFTIMGINAKPDTKSPIGYFGTGLKYAMAVLARHDCTVLVQDGIGNEWILEKYDDAFRGKDFTMLRLVRMNATPVGNIVATEIDLPFTTELGKNWSLWMAVRELESNMRDEGGTFKLLENRPTCKKGAINLIVSGDQFIHCVNTERREIFFDLATIGKKPQLFNNEIEYVLAPSTYIYYRGIKVKEFPNDLQYTYNILKQSSLTEDRTLTEIYNFRHTLTGLFTRDGGADYTRRICSNPEAGEWELFDLYYVEPYQFSQEAKEVILEFFNNSRAKLNDKLRKIGAMLSVEEQRHKDVVLQTDEEDMLEQAVRKLRFAGYLVDDYPIKAVEFVANNKLGEAKDETIYIARLNFENGLECLMGTLLEEYIHIKYSFYDESRDMQDWLLRRLIVHMTREQKLERRLERD